MRNLAWLMACAVMSCATVAAGGSGDDELRKAVFTFERKLQAWPKGQEKERAQAIRDYFAKLKDAAHKIEAIGMMDSRYVYQIPKGMVSELLAPLLKDADIQVRLRAARALGYNGVGGAHYDALVALLKDAKDRQLHDVIYAMGRSKDERFLPHLRPLLKHPDGIVRAHAVLGFAGFPREKVIDDVMALWDDPHEQVRYDLIRFCYPENKENLALVKRRLQDPSSHVRTRAVDYMGHSKDPQAAQAVFAMLADEHRHVRGKALEALGNLRAEAFLDEIVKRFQDAKEDIYVRRMAMIAFENLAAPKHVPLVRAMLRDEDDQVRKQAAHILEVLEKGKPRRQR